MTKSKLETPNRRNGQVRPALAATLAGISVLMLAAVSPVDAAKGSAPTGAGQESAAKQPDHAQPKPGKPTKIKKTRKPKQHCNDFRRACTIDLRRLRIPVLDSTPVPSLPKWGFLTSALGSSNAPLALTVENNSIVAGARVTLEPIASSSRGQLWQAGYTGDGQSATLWSGLGSQIALSLDVTQPSPYPVVTYPSQIPADSVIDDASLFQRWSYDAQDRTIGNEATGGNLYASAAGADVVFSNASGPGSQWSLWPSYPLGAVLSQSPLPFPTGNDQGQIDAYNSINQQLGLAASTCTLGTQNTTGIRCQYVNLAAELGDYKSTIDFLRFPTGATFSLSDFNTVRNQLNLEITAADNVRNLYANASSFIDEVFLDDGTTLSKLAIDAMLQPTTTVSGSAAIAFIEGALYTSLSLLGPEASVAANLMETVVNTAVASPGGNSITNTYLGQVSGLYGNLATGFELILTTLGQQELQVLSDWGKMQAVSALITSTGPGSLAWPPTSAGLIKYAVQGYTTVAMQNLLPVNYRITRTVGQTENSLTGGPSDGVYAEQYGVQSSGDPLWNLYSVATPNNAPPGAAALADVFDNGVSPHDFFNRINGWELFSGADTTLAQDGVAVPCNAALVELTNWTNSSDLTITVVPNEGVLGGNNDSLATGTNVGIAVASGTNQEVLLDVPAYGSTLLAGALDGGLEFAVSVKDSCGTLVSFDLHQHDCSQLTDPDDTWIDNSTTGTGCGGASFTWVSTLTTQNGGDGTDGGIAIDLYRELPVTPPTISSLAPDTGAGGQASAVVDIFGSGFLPGASCVFGGGITVSQCEVLSSIQMEATVSIPLSGTEGGQDVTVTNQNGGTVTAAAAYSVVVEPYIASVDPPASPPNQEAFTTISGYNFETGANCDFGDLGVTSCVVINSTTIQVELNIYEGAALGAVTVTVTNPDGGSASLVDGYTVGDLQPAVFDVNPNSALPGVTQFVAIDGSSFYNASVSFGAGITTGCQTASSYLLNCQIEIAADAAPGARVVTVTNEGGLSATGSYTVDAPVDGPVLTSVNPGQVCYSETTTVTAQGFGIDASATCSVSNEADATLEWCDISAPNYAQAGILAKKQEGSFLFTVTNPDGTTGSWPITLSCD